MARTRESTGSSGDVGPVEERNAASPMRPMGQSHPATGASRGGVKRLGQIQNAHPWHHLERGRSSSPTWPYEDKVCKATHSSEAEKAILERSITPTEEVPEEEQNVLCASKEWTGGKAPVLTDTCRPRFETSITPTEDAFEEETKVADACTCRSEREPKRRFPLSTMRTGQESRLKTK